MYGELRTGVAEVCAEFALSLHRFSWRTSMRRAGLKEAGLYLTRPDGYVALADAHADSARLRQYVDEHIVSAGRAAGAAGTPSLISPG